MPDILIVDDEYATCLMLQKKLKREGYETEIADSGRNALDKLKADHFDLVITDMKMPPGMMGDELIQEVKKIDPDLPVIIITAYADLKDAVELITSGQAFYYFEKPIREKFDEFKREIDNALKTRRGEYEEIVAEEEPEEIYEFSEIIGESPKMKELYRKMTLVIKHGINPVLITGKTGTGKELVARAIHKYGRRNKGKFIDVNCSAIPETLWESELFGHEKGAFTGADARKPGKFEEADGGVLFLDEIGNIDTSVQAKLLRVLEGHGFTRVGSNQPVKVDVCVIAATNKELEEEIKEGNFKDDLFYRLNVIPLELPPLKERKDDIPLLVEHFLKKFSDEYKVPVKQVTPRTMSALKRYDWQGNVRQLENCLRQAFVLSESDVIDIIYPPEISKIKNGPVELQIEIPPNGVSLREIEKQYICEALRQTKGNQTKAAELLGISRRTIQYRMKEHGIFSSDFK